MIRQRSAPLGITMLVLAGSVGFAYENSATPDTMLRIVVADSIVGSWVLNREKSDDPQEAMQESQQDAGGREARGGGGGRRGGASGGRRPRGMSTTGRPAGISPERRERIQASMRDAMRIAPRIQISRTDSTVILATPRGNRVFFTDNREVTVPVGADLDSTVKCKWDKDKLVIESETDAGVKAKYTYEPDGDQLKVEVRIQVSRPRQVVRFALVYDAAG